MWLLLSLYFTESSSFKKDKQMKERVYFLRGKNIYL